MEETGKMICLEGCHIYNADEGSKEGGWEEALGPGIVDLEKISCMEKFRGASIIGRKARAAGENKTWSQHKVAGSLVKKGVSVWL